MKPYKYDGNARDNVIYVRDPGIFGIFTGYNTAWNEREKIILA